MWNANVLVDCDANGRYPQVLGVLLGQRSPCRREDGPNCHLGAASKESRAKTEGVTVRRARLSPAPSSAIMYQGSVGTLRDAYTTRRT